MDNTPTIQSVDADGNATLVTTTTVTLEQLKADRDQVQDTVAFYQKDIAEGKEELENALADLAKKQALLDEATPLHEAAVQAVNADINPMMESDPAVSS